MVRYVYLITYSQGDAIQFTRQRFANAVVSYCKDGVITKNLK